ncbi:MAG: hypothetical protein NT029_11350 [Armatimonadetes bacterium]|nr:hypothetical protein [Armatimonadota bacterium]
MAVPYRRMAPTGRARCVAYLKVHRVAQGRVLFGALLLLDAYGHPQEFIHNRLSLPGGFLWPEERVLPAGLTALCHSLFDAPRVEPDLLLAETDLAGSGFRLQDLAPSVPFGIVGSGPGGSPEVSWVNGTPGLGLPATQMVEDLAGRNLLVEPFERALQGLTEAYGAVMGTTDAQ